MDEQQNRIDERIPFSQIKVCMHTAAGAVLNCELLDVSPSGARVKIPPGEERRKGGEKVMLQMASLPLGELLNNKQALIIWADGEQLGMRLVSPLALPSDDMRRLLGME